MEDILFDGSFGIHWHDLRVCRYEGIRPRMSGFHSHSYYEISLLLQGEMKVLLSEHYADRGQDARVVLLRPFTPHYIIPQADLAYRHVNVEFAADYLDPAVPEFRSLLSLFPEGGDVLHVEEETCRELLAIAEKTERTSDPLRKKIALLSFLAALPRRRETDRMPMHHVPPYLTEALRFLASHYADPLSADALAREVGVGRTTLLTSFRRYTGSTFHEYLTRCRLRHAASLLGTGINEERIAEMSGFGSLCGMIRAFRSEYGTTPSGFQTSSV